MAVFYRGAGIGTYWHTNDATRAGFKPRSPRLKPSCDLLMNHIARGTVSSPFIFLTRSYGVAKDYAVNASRMPPNESAPAYVYIIEVNDPRRSPVKLVDPIVEIARTLPKPWQSLTHYHDGTPYFLLGVVDPNGPNKNQLTTPIEQPPGSAGTPRTPHLSLQLETLVRALRDSEILVRGRIPKACIISLTEFLYTR